MISRWRKLMRGVHPDRCRRLLKGDPCWVCSYSLVKYEQDHIFDHINPHTIICTICRQPYHKVNKPCTEALKDLLNKKL